GGEDQLATQIAAFLIPTTYSPPPLGGAPNLPPELYQNSVANVQTARSPNQSISGQITNGGFPLPGINVGLTGAENKMTQTAPDGKYSFPNLSASGPYTVTPSSDQFSFNPPSQTFQSIVGNQVANFSATPDLFLLSVSKAGTGSGTVTSGDGFINCGTVCSYTYNSGSQVTLTETPSQDSSFTSWIGCDSSNGNTCTVTMISSRTVSATFTLNPIYYTLSVSTSGDGTVTSTDGFISCPGTCSHTYPAGTPVTLNATAGQGWVFGGWNGACLGTGSCALTMTQPLSV